MLHAPLVPGGGAHSLPFEGVGGPNSSEDTYTVVYMYFVPVVYTVPTLYNVNLFKTSFMSVTGKYLSVCV